MTVAVAGYCSGYSASRAGSGIAAASHNGVLTLHLHLLTLPFTSDGDHCADIPIDLLHPGLLAADCAAMHDVRARAVRRVLVRARGGEREHGASRAAGGAALDDRGAGVGVRSSVRQLASR